MASPKTDLVTTPPRYPDAPTPVFFTDEASFRAARRQWESYVMCDGDLIPSHRLVIVRIASFASWDKFAWPSAETIADQLGVSLSTAKRGQQLGLKRGWLMQRGRTGWGGSMRWCLSTRDSVVEAIEDRLEDARDSRNERRTIRLTQAPH